MEPRVLWSATRILIVGPRPSVRAARLSGVKKQLRRRFVEEAARWSRTGRAACR